MPRKSSLRFQKSHQKQHALLTNWSFVMTRTLAYWKEPVVERKALTRPFVATTPFFGPAAIVGSGGNWPVSVTPPNEPPKTGALGAGAAPKRLILGAATPPAGGSKTPDGTKAGLVVPGLCPRSARSFAGP